MPASPERGTGRDRVVADRYAPEQLLGRGGMGTVWRARDQLLQRTVALKEIELPASLPEEERASQKARILREARSAARLSHPNAVTMFDVIEEEGRSYIVMELVDAEPLSEMIDRRGPLPPEEVARIGLGILGALEAAHAGGIVHRDVKPSNVMVADGVVKLADFGIATIKGDPKITKTGLILGSPSYMAPEQARSEPAVPATDLWGLGVTLYAAVEGTGPFERGEAIPTLTAILNAEPRPPQRAGALAGPILDLLTKDIDRRPSLAVVRRSLQDVAAGRSAGTTVRLDPGAPTEPAERPARGAMPSEPARRRTKPERPEDRRPARSAAWLVALGVLALLLVAALVVPRLIDDESPRAGGETGEQTDNEGRGSNDGDSRSGRGEDGGGAPEGWNTYAHPDTGYRIAYPDGWTIDPIDTRTDFVAPNGDYLRVDYTTSPGTTQQDHVEAWQAQSASFAEDHDDYREIRIDATTFRSWPGAEWEYAYQGRHAINLGFTVSESYGFALNYVTDESRWAGAQDTFETMKESFRAP
ncbi:MAG: protein kinase [Actinobacteria bacterium]|nr:protein kinase [Actinomycetota bacterium]